MKRILTLVLLLGGCGQSDNNHGYGAGFDETGSTGIRVRYLDDTSPRLEFVEQMYRETMGCVGVQAPGPLVIWLASVTDANTGESTHGFIYLDSGTVLADNNACLLGSCKMLAYQGHVLKHEFVHWLLHWSKRLTAEQQRTHDAPEFTTCTNVSLS